MQLKLTLRFTFNPPQVCMHIKNVFIYLFACNDRRTMLVVVVVVAALVYPQQLELKISTHIAQTRSQLLINIRRCVFICL